MPRYLGQHFLKDQSKLTRTVSAIQKLLESEHCTGMLEIGPGKGALTKRICDLVPHFLCLEKDRTMQPHLLTFLDPEHIIWDDVLERDTEGVSSFPSDFLVVGNLPYYITSPIFRKFFVDDSRASGGVFLIQKEVAEKIMSDAAKKSYLRWLITNRYHVEYLFTVKPKCFNPPPKVDSAVVQLVRKEHAEIEETSALLIFLEHVSSMKRKTLGAIHKRLKKKGTTVVIPDELLTLRLEALSWEDMKSILSHNTF